MSLGPLMKDHVDRARPLAAGAQIGRGAVRFAAGAASSGILLIMARLTGSGDLAHKHIRSSFPSQQRSRVDSVIAMWQVDHMLAHIHFFVKGFE
jgi:hypothetical protein